MCILEGYNLKKYIEKYPQVAFKIIDELSKRLEVAEELIESINLHSVESRLAQILLKLANKYNVIELEMSIGNFASQIGMSQETLSRKLSLFQEQGLVKLIGQRKIAIINKNGLENIV
jgi:CRP/FNR family transcriptional regulator